jgi:hypothetical protein
MNDLSKLRKISNPDLCDDVFADDQYTVSGEDWRKRVPPEIRAMWDDMNSSERLGVVLMAKHTAATYTNN